MSHEFNLDQYASFQLEKAKTSPQGNGSQDAEAESESEATPPSSSDIAQSPDPEEDTPDIPE